MWKLYKIDKNARNMYRGFSRNLIKGILGIYQMVNTKWLKAGRQRCNDLMYYEHLKWGPVSGHAGPATESRESETTTKVRTVAIWPWCKWRRNAITEQQSKEVGNGGSTRTALRSGLLIAGQRRACASGRRRRAYPLTVQAPCACARARVFVSYGVWYSPVVACCCCRCLCLSFATPGFVLFSSFPLSLSVFPTRPLIFIGLIVPPTPIDVHRVFIPKTRFVYFLWF